MGARAGLERCGKSRPHWDSTPGPSSPQQVATPTETSQSPVIQSLTCYAIKINDRKCIYDIRLLQNMKQYEVVG